MSESCYLRVQGVLTVVSGSFSYFVLAENEEAARQSAPQGLQTALDLHNQVQSGDLTWSNTCQRSASSFLKFNWSSQQGCGMRLEAGWAPADALVRGSTIERFMQEGYTEVPCTPAVVEYLSDFQEAATAAVGDVGSRAVPAVYDYPDYPTGA